jgi:ABC-type uncharacterized transport system substrate-binding protein
MKRRRFMALLGAAATWPLTARAQQSGMPVIGVLNSGSRETSVSNLTAFRKGLNEAGFVEGQNVAIEYRWAQGQYDQLSEMATDLVQRRVAVIAASGTAPTRAAQGATNTIPIVFMGGGDPIGAGLVASLNRPAENVTGVTLFNAVLGPKRLELLYELLPRTTRVAMLVNRGNPITEASIADVRSAARALGVQVQVVDASSDRDIDAAFAMLAKSRVGPVLIGADAFFVSRSERPGARALRHAVPAIFSYREFAASGGLISYSASRADAYRQAGLYVGRILKGESPADLPVLQPTKFELIVNLKTAMSLGLEVPPTLLARADEVIE